MTPTADATRLHCPRLGAAVLALTLAVVATVPAAGQEPLPTFSKSFEPATIGPGSISMLVFTIGNPNPFEPVANLAFTDNLPAGMTLAAPAFVSNGCGGTVTATDGGTTVSLVDGTLGVGAACTIVVNVTADAIDDTTYMNVSGDLTSDAGNSGTASADLTIDVERPGFSKSFAPSTVAFGGRTTLTFTIDNTTECGECAPVVTRLDFTDDLPAGMVVADPANAATDCENPASPATLNAVPGTQFISLSSFAEGLPVLGAEETCTVTVDVLGGAVGSLGNVTSELLVQTTQQQLSSGKAAAVLEVTGVEGLLELAKSFVDDPVPPGGTVTLEFTVTNKSRDAAATGISFSDDLEKTLGGLTPNLPPTPDPPCGAGSSLAFGTGVLTLSGGSLPPEGSCTFGVELSVPAAAAPGSYANSAGPVKGDVGGEPETGNTAGDLLFVVSFPVLSKEFTDDPVSAGGTVTLEFTITNPESTSAMSAIAFVDELTAGTTATGPTNGFLPFPVSVGLPPTPDPPCGAGSSLALVSLGTDRQGLELTGGSLAAAGSTGDSCTFSVTVDIPPGLASGTYANTTGEISAVLDAFTGAPTVSGPPASDTLVVVSAPSLIKEFIDDPVLPGGGPVTLEFTLLYDAEGTAPDAADVAFSDDLTALSPAVPGLTATSVGANSCAGSTVDISMATLIDVSGASLSPGESCVISVTLSVPAASPAGFHTNTTSDVTATIGGLAVSNIPAEDDLLITPLLFSKEFVDDPVIAGGTVTLDFTIENVSAADATGISFSDDLSAVLPGTPDLTVITPLPLMGVCGGSSMLSAVGPSLSFTGGSLLASTSCTFGVTLAVPAGTVDDAYRNTTNGISSSVGTAPAAVDLLFVNSTLLALTKEFTDDPVTPGGTVSLEFTLENLSATDTVTDIAFADDLGAALSGLVATGATSDTCGGTPAGLGTGLFQYSGGTLMPGATCTITLGVDVPPAPLPGTLFPNTTTGVSGKVGPLDVFGDPASDDLEIQLLSFSKSFDGPTTATGSAVLTFTISNLDSSSPVVGLAFSDDLGAVISGLTASLPPTPDPPCGAGSVLAGASFLAFTGGSLAAAGSPGDSCTFAVTVDVPATAAAGSFLNITGDLVQSGIPVADPAIALLSIEPAPTFAKEFAPATILLGEVSTLTFTIDNSASALAATALDFTDSLPAGLVIASPANASTDCTGGILVAVAGSGTIGYTGGSVAAGASCSVRADVTSGAPGDYVNLSGDLTSSSGNSGAAGDTLTVLPPPAPAFAKAFTPDVIVEGFDTTLTFAIDNSASAVTATGLAFLDLLPFGLEVASPPMVGNSCGGSVVAAPGAVSISLSGGSVGAGATCTLSVQVTASFDAVFVNASGDLTSSSGNSGSATDTLTAVPCEAADGVELTLGSDVVLVPESYEACKTIRIEQHYLVLGPNGKLSLTAGISVILFNGVEFAEGSEATFELDPSLTIP